MAGGVSHAHVYDALYRHPNYFVRIVRACMCYLNICFRVQCASVVLVCDPHGRGRGGVSLDHIRQRLCSANFITHMTVRVYSLYILHAWGHYTHTLTGALLSQKKICCVYIAVRSAMAPAQSQRDKIC